MLHFVRGVFSSYRPIVSTPYLYLPAIGRRLLNYNYNFNLHLQSQSRAKSTSSSTRTNTNTKARTTTSNQGKITGPSSLGPGYISSPSGRSEPKRTKKSKSKNQSKTKLSAARGARDSRCRSTPERGLGKSESAAVSVNYEERKSSQRDRSDIKSKEEESGYRYRLLRLPSRKPRSVSEGLWSLTRGIRIKVVGFGRPRVIVLEGRTKKEKEHEHEQEMPKAGFYAVAAGREKGVYTTWAEAEAQVKGYAGAKYKKFPREAQAKAYVASPSSPTPSSIYESPPKLAKPASPHISSAPSTSKAKIPNPPYLPRGGSSKDTHTRATSPPSYASSSDLPPRLHELARKGYTFSGKATSGYYLVVYTDGSARGNGQVGSRAGAGVWWGSKGDAAARNISERVPGLPQTNNRGELLAVIRALEQCPFPDIPLEIRCDSQYTISCMTTWLPKWLSTNFRTSTKPQPHCYSSARGSAAAAGGSKQVMNVDMIKHLLVLLRRRGTEGRVKFKYVPAHSGVEGNECADKLANMGAMMPPIQAREDWLDPDTEFDTDTALDVTQSQSQAHSGQSENVTKSGSKSKRSEGVPLQVTDVEVEIDENWLMTPDELEQFEKGFVSE